MCRVEGSGAQGAVSPWKAHEIKDFRDRVLVVHIFRTTAATIECSDFIWHEVSAACCGGSTQCQRSGNSNARQCNW